ncbi:MAG: methyltransferase [Candidatus Buchananbacteria bacterium]
MDSRQYIKPLSKKEKASVLRMRDNILEQFRKTPKTGIEVKHLGKSFIVPDGVFWPRPDSESLIKNFIIRKGEIVLDVCTGSGVIAINAALKGAKKVIAVDISPKAVKAAILNVKRFKLEKIIEVRKSNVFSGVNKKEKFNVITFNPPFYNEPAKDLIDRTMKDPGFKTTIKFFKDVKNYLKTKGRIYVAQANSGDVLKMIELAEKSGFSVRPIGKKKMPESPLEFYAFELLFK